MALVYIFSYWSSYFHLPSPGPLLGYKERVLKFLPACGRALGRASLPARGRESPPGADPDPGLMECCLQARLGPSVAVLRHLQESWPCHPSHSICSGCPRALRGCSGSWWQLTDLLCRLAASRTPAHVSLSPVALFLSESATLWSLSFGAPPACFLWQTVSTPDFGS